MKFADLRVRAERWIADDPDPVTRDELRALLTHEDLAETDLEERFAGPLEFGTAGLRAVMGAGPNRMNRAVVARATWGLAHEIAATIARADERVVVVGGDARKMSRELSDDVAAILAAAGLRVVLFSAPVPTPLVGFAVKRLGAAAGVVITASHNPPEYNGYKVYWQDAAQIAPPTDARVSAAIARAPAARDIERPSLSALRQAHRVVDASPEIEREYLQAVRSLAVHPEEGDRRLSIVYTPLHGVGGALVRRAFADARFTSFLSVAEQDKPDGTFPTVAFPNPEEPGALDRALALAAEVGADLVLANDPDADRLAVAVARTAGGRDAGSRRVSGGGASLQPHDIETPEAAPRVARARSYLQLTGNQVGVLLGYYLLTERPATSRRRAVVTSIVSSPLLGRIALDLGVHHEQTLTGFKWIARRAIELQHEGYEFVLGYEEALGYCVGSVVYDKDGISAALIVAEMAAVLRARGRTLCDVLDEIARRWGVCVSAQLSITREGACGRAAIGAMMDGLRTRPPSEVAGDAVVGMADYEANVHVDFRTGARSPLALPSSNVLSLELASGSRIIARPSGTEPKAKFYFDVCGSVGPADTVAEASARAEVAVRRLSDAFVGPLA
jgi:phosphomannomutase